MANSSERVTFNEANVAKDVAKIMEIAKEVDDLYMATNTKIDDEIANGDDSNVFSGPAATSTRNQWDAAYHNFKLFMTSFDEWYQAAKYVTEKIINTQQNLNKVEGIDGAN